MNDGDDDEDDCTKDDDDEWRWWWWWWMTVMMMNGGVDDEIEDSGGDDDERRWWKFVSGDGSLFRRDFRWWSLFPDRDGSLVPRLFPFGEWRWWVCFVLFGSALVSFGGVENNYVGLPVNGLDLCRVHKDSLCMITTPAKYTFFRQNIYIDIFKKAPSTI